MRKNQKFNQLTCFPLHFVAACNTEISLFFPSAEPQTSKGENRNHRWEIWGAGRKGWQEQTCWKYIFAVGYQLEYITQINAINISHKRKIQSSHHTHYTPHTARKTIRHKFHVFDLMFCIHLHRIALHRVFFYFVILIECTFNCIWKVLSLIFDGFSSRSLRSGGIKRSNV